MEFNNNLNVLNHRIANNAADAREIMTAAHTLGLSQSFMGLPIAADAERMAHLIWDFLRGLGRLTEALWAMPEFTTGQKEKVAEIIMQQPWAWCVGRSPMRTIVALDVSVNSVDDIEKSLNSEPSQAYWELIKEAGELIASQEGHKLASQDALSALYARCHARFGDVTIEVLKYIVEFIKSGKGEKKQAPPPDLRACPFCGSKAEYKHIEGSYGYSPPNVQVRCGGCEAHSPRFLTEGWSPKRGHYDKTDVGIKEAARWWNGKRKKETK